MSVRIQRAFNFSRAPFAKDVPAADLFLDEARSHTRSRSPASVSACFSIAWRTRARSSSLAPWPAAASACSR